MTPLFSESTDPLAFHFLAEHQRRYERIKAWRAAQRNPYFTEVTPQWRQEFEHQSVDKFAKTPSFPQRRESRPNVAVADV